MSVDEPWDSGLQPERTALAWRRFAVALAVVGVATLRALSYPQLDWTSAVTGVAVVAIALVIGLRGTARYGTSHRALHASQPLPGGVLIAVAAAGVAVLGVIAAASMALSD